MVRSGRSAVLTPADCAAACWGSASAEATAAVRPAEAPKKSRRDCFLSDIVGSPSLIQAAQTPARSSLKRSPHIGGRPPYRSSATLLAIGWDRSRSEEHTSE